MKKTLVVSLLLLAGCAAQPWTPKTIPEERIDLKVEPLSELDGKTTKELADLRSQALARENRLGKLVPSPYKFEERSVWEKIESGASWNGTEGHFQGTRENQAQTFANGESLDSVVVANPFLLAALSPHFALLQGRDSFQQDWSDSQLPESLVFEGKAHCIIASYIHHGALLDYRNMEGAVYNLNLINAQDLGLQAFAVVKKDTQGFSGIDNLAGHSFQFDHVYPLSQRYGTDSVPNSQNKLTNLFYDSEVVVLDKLPATLKLAFWLDPKAQMVDQPDFFEEIKVSNSVPQFNQIDLKRLRN